MNKNISLSYKRLFFFMDHLLAKYKKVLRARPPTRLKTATTDRPTLKTKTKTQEITVGPEPSLQ